MADTERPEDYLCDYVPEPFYIDAPTETDEVSQDIVVKVMDIRELRELGFIHEINRLILHPAGLALSVQLHPDGTETLSTVWDCREDPEGVLYGENYLDPIKAQTVAKYIETRGPHRAKKAGFIIQPVDPDYTQLSLTVKEPFRQSSDDTRED